MLENAERENSQINDGNTAKLLLEDTEMKIASADANKYSSAVEPRQRHCPPGWIFVGSPYPHCEKNGRP